MAKKKKQAEAEKENGERWLVSYADFMTLLLGLFIILYSAAAADAEATGSGGSHQQSAIAALAEAFGGSPIAETNNNSIIDLGNIAKQFESSSMEQVGEEIEELAEDLGISGSINVTIDSKGLHIRLTDDVLFDSGKYKVSTNAEYTLTAIGNLLKTLPNNNILIEGHTDNIPINSGLITSNWELGALRATNVARLLIEKCALSPEKIATVSYGEHQPIGSNRTPDGRAANRRVEITVLRNYPATETNTMPETQIPQIETPQIDMPKIEL